MWLDGQSAKAVIAAAREAMTNVDRHARAGELRVAVSAQAVVLEDDGVGFDPNRPRRGHGVSDSILGRMQRAGGRARIRSTPGVGTVTELSWAAGSAAAVAAKMSDPDRLIGRIRVRYGTALTAYAVANLAFAVPYAVMTAGPSRAQAALGALAALSVLTAIPGIRHGRWRAAWPAAAALLVVTVVQPWLLPVELVGGPAHWAQNAVGWCIVPLVLGLPTRIGAAAVILYWVVGAVVAIICEPSAHVLVNIGLGSASILGVQLFALVFNGLVRDAAADAQAETDAQKRLLARDQVAQALRAEYQRRYARLVDSVVPLLRVLSRGGAVDEDLQRRARAESRRLRALFDQAATFDHPLMQQLRPVVDAAEARHVDVAIDLAAELPDLTATEITGLVRPVARVLEATTTSARIVVDCSPGEISASIVCRGISCAARLSEDLARATDDIDAVTSDDAVWFLIRHRLPKGAAEHALAG